MKVGSIKPISFGENLKETRQQKRDRKLNEKWDKMEAQGIKLKKTSTILGALKDMAITGAVLFGIDLIFKNFSVSNIKNNKGLLALDLAIILSSGLFTGISLKKQNAKLDERNARKNQASSSNA